MMLYALIGFLIATPIGIALAIPVFLIGFVFQMIKQRRLNRARARIIQPHPASDWRP